MDPLFQNHNVSESYNPIWNLCFRIIRQTLNITLSGPSVSESYNPRGYKISQKFTAHWSRTSEHQASTGSEIFSTGPEYQNGRNKIC
jgi:hypothetical protein